MHSTHEIRLQGPAAHRERISGPLLHDVLHLVVEGSQRAVRYRIDGRSTGKGPAPSWVRRASAFDVLQLNDGRVIRLDVPSLADAMPERFAQRELFATLDPNKSSLDLFEDGLEDALNGEADSDLFDEGLISTFVSIRSLLGEGLDSLSLVNGRTVPVTVDSLQRVAEMERALPRAQRVRVAGRLETIRFSDRMFILVLATGEKIRGVAEDSEVAKLASLWGHPAAVTGYAHFRPSGGLSRVEADIVEPARDADLAMFQAVPRPQESRLDPRSLRVPQGPRTGVNAIWGQIPYEPGESEAEFVAAVQELS